MKALLTACTAIACAATQVTWLEGPPSEPATARAPAAPHGDAGSALRAGAHAASARGASALAAPALATGSKS